MIPSKLYIPTSTLNFNNIMASESISPAIFYSIRGFGYKRFDKVAPNNLDNRIILFDKYPVFNINNKELENYSLVIEIDTKTISEDIICEYENGVFYCEETIYLNPFSTQFIFNNESEKRSTLSKVEQSLNTKMLALYQNINTLEMLNLDVFNWENIDIKDSQKDNSAHISKDRRINKLKGFLYAYLLGANKSLPTVIVELKKSAKELENVLSSIITSPDNRATYQQEEQLKRIYQSLYNAFLRTDDNFKSLLKQKVEQYKCENFIDILRIEGVLDFWLQKQNIKPKYQFRQFNISNNSSHDEKQKAFDYYISEITNAINKISVPKKLDVQELPTLLHNNRIDNVQNKPFLPKLFNGFLAENWNSDEFINGRLDFATAGGNLFKEELHDNWDNSPYKNYINDLRNNLASHTSFSVQNTDNLTLKSFGAFCQKGENDIDKLEDYLISNKIGDFRIAFALWGIVFGFSNMPKTLTNDLFLSDDLDYVSNVYKFIFKQIHDIELKGTLIRKNKTEYVTVSSKINEVQPLNSLQTNDNTIALVQELSIFEEFTSRDKIVQKEIITKLNENQIYSLADWNDKKVDSIKWSSNKGQKKLMSLISKSKNNSKQKKQPIQLKESTLFNTQPEKEFYKDTNVGVLIEDLLPNDKKIRKQFKEDLDWFQGNYHEYFDDKKKGKQKGYYFGKPTDNYSVIEKFQDYLKNKKISNQDWLRKIYTSIDTEQIIIKLKQLYS